MQIWQKRLTSLRRSVAPYVLLLTLFQKKRLKIMVKPTKYASPFHLFWASIFAQMNPIVTFFNFNLFLKTMCLAKEIQVNNFLVEKQCAWQKLLRILALK